MKNIIFGYHVDDVFKKIYFWNYDESEFYKYEVKESSHAICNTQNGYRLVKVCGYGVMEDDLEIAHKEVVKFVNIDKKARTND